MVQRKSIRIEGIVQGVGFRPFVYQLAISCGVGGWVRNDSRGVLIEAEGSEAALTRFLRDLRQQHPPLASISRFESSDLPCLGETDFAIIASDAGLKKTAQVSPDTYVCNDCLGELFDPTDRRYRYPFINCTNCGPRYTIVTDIPYDRPNTTMVSFTMCPLCRTEYEDPTSRRFHAQPNACPVCGPRLSLFDSTGKGVTAEDPLGLVMEQLRAGRIVAIKGLGGYHLAVDAANDAAVLELRRRKHRDEKPFALMVRDLAVIRELTLLGETEERLLQGPERPIVLLRQKETHPLSAAVAPNNRFFGIMLPYTPLHHLLMQDFPALVMTSANQSDEPIAFEDVEARQRLDGIADWFLTHDRDIYARTDDSIARVVAGRPLLLRRSRGYVPRSVFLPREQVSVLAVGAELKNTICLTQADRAYLSQHIGDLKNLEVYDSFVRTIDHLQRLFEIEPEIVACDLHPDYYSSRYAEELTGIRRLAVQHHHAHLASCMAEHGLQGHALGVIFDGIGYGTDGKIWGGEFLVGGYDSFSRFGHFRYAPMPGGDAATREPLRMALSYLLQAYGEAWPALPALADIAPKEQEIWLQMLARGVNSPLTSSCGRLFDAVSALLGLRSRVSFEGQAALELEMAIVPDAGEYPFTLLVEEGTLIFDPVTTLRTLVADLLAGESVGRISARFHNTLARMLVAVCHRMRETTGLDRVVLSGGVFQNLYLTERSVGLLHAGGFQVYCHSLVPPNDGGLALGQAVVAGALSA